MQRENQGPTKLEGGCVFALRSSRELPSVRTYVHKNIYSEAAGSALRPRARILAACVAFDCALVGRRLRASAASASAVVVARAARSGVS